ncbi:hypothetical protein HDU82_009038 [Entophlyctis luteolus]|nr:hypothetical protein HDU82_009038 [Entophlyctis luteolus]
MLTNQNPTTTGSHAGRSSAKNSAASNYHKLPPRADYFQFHSWFKAFHPKADKDFGHATQIWIPGEKRTSVLQPFSPSGSHPVAPESILDFEFRHTSAISKAETDRDNKLVEVNSLRRQLDAAVMSLTAGAEKPDSIKAAEQQLEEMQVEYDKLRLAADFLRRQYDDQFRLFGSKQTLYTNDLKRYEVLLKAHSQWVNFLKESIDIADADYTISGAASFSAMIDKLYVACNSRNQTDMLGEWERHWDMAEAKQRPIDIALFSGLRDRFFEVNGGFTTDLDKQFAQKFKRRVLDILGSASPHQYAGLQVRKNCAKWRH